MGWHCCKHPYWHRALILFGTVFYFCGGLWLWVHLWHWKVISGETAGVGVFGFFFSVVLLKYLLIWRCQGREPGGARWSIGVGIRWRW